MLRLLLLLAMGFVYYTVIFAVAAWLVIKHNKALHLVGSLLAIYFFLVTVVAIADDTTSIVSEGLGWFVSALLLLNIFFAYQFGMLAWASKKVSN